MRNSNNYNMKNSHPKIHQSLDLLHDINMLREDGFLFSKIIIFENDKKIRSKYTAELVRCE